MLNDISRSKLAGAWCTSIVISTRTLVATALLVAVIPALLHGQDRARYRDYHLGASLASVSALTGVAATDTKAIHDRPAVRQELQWRRPYVLSTPAPPIDSAKQILFSFYDDQQIVVDYDSEQTAGMTDADLTEAISTQYGPVSKPDAKASRALPSRVETESGTVVGRWGDADVAVALLRVSYASGFRLIVTSPRLDALAQAAEAKAQRLDLVEGPRRERDRQKKEAADAQALLEQARLTNKAAFRP
jgi:hypothetical protein